jgi:cytochrome P450 / NADPH-cytochrome P450 reductase
MMGFMQEREQLIKGGAALGPALLFFGCRSSGEDYIYRGRLEAYEAGGVISGLHVAFSRDGPSKVYVQVRRRRRRRRWRQRGRAWVPKGSQEGAPMRPRLQAGRRLCCKTPAQHLRPPAGQPLTRAVTRCLSPPLPHRT